MNGTTALAISKSYTDESLDGVGALKGVPCTVKSKTAIEGGTRLVLGWTSNSGVESETIVDIMNGVDGQDGADGKGIKSVTINEEEHFIITYTDDTTSDAGKIEVQSAVQSVNGKTGDVVLKTSDLANDSNYVSDASYVHTDNNYTTGEKTKLGGIEANADVNVIESITVNGDAITPDANKNVAITVITNTVNNLVNYYLKSETYNKTEVDNIVDAIKNSRFEVVATLPTTDIQTNVIYLVPKADAQSQNIKDEYINLDGTTTGWEKIGDTEIDLSSYVTTTALNTALADYTTTADLTTLLDAKANKDDLGVYATKELLENTVGWTNKNLFNKATVNRGYVLGSVGELVANDLYNTSDYIKVSQGTTYYASHVCGSNNARTAVFYDESKNYLSTVTLPGTTDVSGSVTVPDLAYYVRFVYYIGNDDIVQFEEGSEATSYEPYHENVSEMFEGVGKRIVHLGTGSEYNDFASQIELPNALGVNAEDVKAKIEPIQDLHGYDYPWIGGTGKNLLPTTLDNLKAQNTEGTWNNNVYTVRGVTFTVVGEDGYVDYVNANGTITGTVNLNFFYGFRSTSYETNLPNGSYRLVKSNGSIALRGVMYRDGIVNTYLSNTTDFEVTDSDKLGGVYFTSTGGNVLNNVVLRAMILKAPVTSETYEPYENICPISGHTECRINRAGKNLFDASTSIAKRYINSSGEISNSNNWSVSDFIAVKGSTTYTLSGVTNVFYTACHAFYDASKNFISAVLANGHDTFETPQDAVYVRLSLHDEAPTMAQLEEGTVATSFEPYKGNNIYTIDLNGTRYGGELDVTTGELVVDRAFVDLGTLDWETSPSAIGNKPRMISTDLSSSVKKPSSEDNAFNGICSQYKAISNNESYYNAIGIAVSYSTGNLIVYDERYTDATAFKTAMDGVQLVYELATPTVIQLTPQQIKLLSGYNVLYASTGDIAVTTSDIEGAIEQNSDLIAEIVEEKLNYRTSKVYGFHINGNESNPSNMVTYLADAVGMTPAHMDYTNDVFSYGSWEDVWFVRDCKPCILNQDGTVKTYLDKNDFTKDIDGNTVDIDENLEGANVMIEFPKIWLKVVLDKNDDSSGTVSIAPIKLDADYKDYPYIDYQGNHKEHFYMPAYNGSNVNNVMRSLSGQQVSKTQTAQQEIDLCEANGDGWYTEDAGEVMLINFLLILMAKTTDTQTAYGQGLHTGGDEAINDGFRTGVHSQKGMFYGTNSGTIASGSYENAVKVFGIENWYGFQWRRYAGDINDNGTRKIKLCYGNEDGSTTFDFNTTGEGYVNVGATPSGTSGGYINKMKFGFDGMYSVRSSGSSSTYYPDGQWFDNAQLNYALHGGTSANGLLVGALCEGLASPPGGAGWSRGAAPSWK